MKKAITAAIIIILLLAIGIKAAGNHNFLYPQTCIITAIDEEKDLVTVETCTGLQFQFYGIQDYDNGDLVAILFFGGWTSKVTDDVILLHRYAGWPELYENYG